MVTPWLDKENSDNLWAMAIAKEIRKTKIAYVEVDGVKPDNIRANKIDELRGYQEIKCHTIFKKHVMLP